MCGVAPVENPIQRDQRPIPLDYCMFAWDCGTRGKRNSANFMLQSSGNLNSSRQFLPGRCLSLSKGVLRLSAFFLLKSLDSFFRGHDFRIPFSFPYTLCHCHCICGSLYLYFFSLSILGRSQTVRRRL
jgi:hypothetical protein